MSVSGTRPDERTHSWGTAEQFLHDVPSYRLEYAADERRHNDHTVGVATAMRVRAAFQDAGASLNLRSSHDNVASISALSVV